MQAPPRFGLQLKPRRAKSSLSGRIVVRLEFDPHVPISLSWYTR